MSEYLFFAVLWGWVGFAIMRPHWKAIVQKMKAQDVSAHRLQLKPTNSEVDYTIIRGLCIMLAVLWPVPLFILLFLTLKKWRERES